MVSWGEVLWDEFPDGARLGGAPANLAYHLAALGRPVALVSRVGDDPRGHEARARLAAAGVDVSAVQVDPARPTGAVGVTLEGGEPRYAMRPGGAWEHIAFDAAAAAAVGDAAVFCLGTLALRRGIDVAAAAIAALPAGAIVASDPNVRDGRDDPAAVRWLIDQVRIAKLNEHEVEVLRERYGVAEPVAYLLERGALVVAVTRGAAGCTLFAPGDRGGTARIDQPGFPAAPGGDSVGCGDAFTAVLLHLHLAGAPLARIAEAACRYAAFVAGQPGATPPVPAEVVAAVTRR